MVAKIWKIHRNLKFCEELKMEKTANFEFGAVQKCENLVDLQEFWRMRLRSLSKASIQPRTCPIKFGLPLAFLTALPTQPITYYHARSENALDHGIMNSLMGRKNSISARIQDISPSLGHARRARRFERGSLYGRSGAPQQPCSQSQRSASIAAMAPVPADVMAWR
jgi:hypothetical protein